MAGSTIGRQGPVQRGKNCGPIGHFRCCGRGEETFNRLHKSGLRLLGRRYEIEAFEEARPDAMGGRCCGWCLIAAHCSREARCALCVGERRTDQYKYRVEGCLVGKARRAHMPWLNASTVEDSTSLRRACAPRRKRHNRPLKGGVATPTVTP